MTNLNIIKNLFRNNYVKFKTIFVAIIFSILDIFVCLQS